MAQIDYRSFGIGKPPPDNSAGGDAQDVKWWTKKGKECADSISTALKVIDHAQLARVTQLMASARLYGNTPLIGTAGNTSRFTAVQTVLKERLNYNAVQSVIDTAIARLTRDKPTPFHLTSGGDYHTQRKAKKLNELRDGIFYECQAYRKGELAARDGAIWGDGIIKVFPKDGRVCMERMPCTQLYVDEMEALGGDPRSLHQVFDVDRDILFESFPKKEKQIDDANPSPGTTTKSPNVADIIQVRESWHLPSGPEATDGRHVISIAGETLLEEKWDHDFFPFARFPWCPKQLGFWSQGLAEQLQPMQLELNKLLHSLQISYNRATLMMWLIAIGSKINKTHINNEIGIMVDYVGEKPECYVPPIAPPEIYTQIETLIRRMREVAGLSEMATQGQIPRGMEDASGKALRALDDIETVRFTQISHAYEQFYIDIDKLAVACAQDIAEEQGEYEVRVPGKRAMQTRKWSEIDLEPDDYSIHVYPKSGLADDFAGRLADVTEGIQAGMIPPELGPELMDFPDLKRFDTLHGAMEERLNQVLDEIVDEGEYEPPEPYYNLVRADELALQYLVLGESQGLEPERVEMLRRWRSQVKMFTDMAQAAQAAMMQPPMPGVGGPQAVPQPPPVSPLLPNSPGAQA